MDNPFLSISAHTMKAAREALAGGSYEISEHVLRHLRSQALSLQEMECSIANGVIIEIHTNPKRGTGYLCVVEIRGKPLHIFFSDPLASPFRLLLTYFPGPPVWDDPRSRAQEGERCMKEPTRKCFFCGGPLKEITVGNFDYRSQGLLYVIKDVPANICLQCGEKYITANTAKKIDSIVDSKANINTENILVMGFNN